MKRYAQRRKEHTGGKTKNWTVRISVNAEDVVYREFRALSAEEAVRQAAEAAVEGGTAAPHSDLIFQGEEKK